VAATVTVHHLDLTIDAVVGKNINFCKPVAKLESDREAIRKVVMEGNPKFFLGSDSAPHPRAKKESCCGAAAGMFSQKWLLPYLADVLDRLGCLPKIFDFACTFGADFFGLKPVGKISVKLVRKPLQIPDVVECGGEEVVPYRASEVLRFTLELIYLIFAFK
jgi:dihydroorotase